MNYSLAGSRKWTRRKQLEKIERRKMSELEWIETFAGNLTEIIKESGYDIISDKKFNNLYVYSVINNPYKIYE